MVLLLCGSPSRISADSVTNSPVAAPFLSTSMRSLEFKWDVFVDLTMFSEENEWDESLLDAFKSLLSQEASQGMQNIIFINPNSFFMSVSKKYSMLLNPPHQEHKVSFVSSAQDLAQYLTEDNNELPNHTISILEREGNSYSSVSIIRQKKEIPVTLYISDDQLYLVYNSKPSATQSTINAPIIDSYYLNTVSEFGVGNSPNEFFVINSKTELRFLSAQSEIILQNISQAVSLSKLVTFKGDLEKKMLNTEDLPGTLLNIAFFNICSENDVLRLAGLELLTSMEASRGISNLGLPPGFYLLTSNFCPSKYRIIGDSTK